MSEKRGYETDSELVKRRLNESSAAISAACAWYELSTRVREL